MLRRWDGDGYMLTHLHHHRQHHHHIIIMIFGIIMKDKDALIDASKLLNIPSNHPCTIKDDDHESRRNNMKNNIPPLKKHDSLYLLAFFFLTILLHGKDPTAINVYTNNRAKAWTRT